MKPGSTDVILITRGDDGIGKAEAFCFGDPFAYLRDRAKLARESDFPHHHGVWVDDFVCDAACDGECHRHVERGFINRDTAGDAYVDIR